jgi:hypothetical protein
MEEKLTTDQKELSKRLDALIYIMLNKTDGHLMLLKDQVSLLDGLKFRPMEIAGILGKTSTHINKELASIRKFKKGNKNGQKKATKKRK